MYMTTGNFDAFCVTTNGVVKKDGKAVMGAGIDERLAFLLNNYGNNVYHLGSYEHGKILSFPTKIHWRDNSDIDLIKRSCIQLEQLIDKHGYTHVILPRPGCSNGKLSWE